MKVIIGSKTYTQIKDLSFAPEADIVGNELPINQFSVSIMTTDIIDTGNFALLYDDSDGLWARYWVTRADKVADNQIDLTAQSLVILLDRITLPPNMYSGALASTVIADLFSAVNAKYPNSYTLDESFASATLSGYVPEQTARERLQWVCFVIGAYVKAYFNDKIELLPIVDDPTFIPINQVYWRPDISYDDYVTAIKANVYSYTQGTPESVDEWVEVNGVYYIQTKQEFSLQNPIVPSTALDNEIFFEDLTLINDANVSGILSRISTYYFQREKVSAEIVNNADYYPAERVTVNTDSDDMVSGYIKSCTFTFGLRAKSSIELVQTDTIVGEELIIRYFYGTQRLREAKYKLPIGYEYNIQNPYIDLTSGNIRRVYRPLTEAASGTMIEGGVYDDEYYEIALEKEGNILKIYSVDEVEQNDSIVEVA